MKVSLILQILHNSYPCCVKRKQMLIYYYSKVAELKYCFLLAFQATTKMQMTLTFRSEKNKLFTIFSESM